MIIKQTPQFKKAYKKLNKNQLQSVNQAIEAICKDPELGEEKKGDLQGVRVHKFRFQKLIYLLAYGWDGEKLILLLTMGVHENFYDKMKR